MRKVKVIYGSTTGNTKDAAKLIACEFACEAIDVASAKIEDFDAEVLILGTSTWGIGDPQDDWTAKTPLLEKLDWQGRKAALFGMGDQMGFGDSYMDGLRVIYDCIVKRGGIVIGRWSAAGYRHNSSQAQIGGDFIGLALDADNEADKIPERIKKWCSQIKSEAAL